MIHLKALIICNVNGGVKRKRITLKHVKLFFKNTKELLNFIVNRQNALSKKYNVEVIIHSQTIE